MQSNLKSLGETLKTLSNNKSIYFLKSFLSFSKYYVSLEFVSGLVTKSLSIWIGSYTTWIECAPADPAAAAAMLCWCAQLRDVTLRDFMSGGALLLIDDENAKPRRRVALWVNGREWKLIKQMLTEYINFSCGGVLTISFFKTLINEYIINWKQFEHHHLVGDGGG